MVIHVRLAAHAVRLAPLKQGYSKPSILYDLGSNLKKDYSMFSSKSTSLEI